MRSPQCDGESRGITSRPIAHCPECGSADLQLVVEGCADPGVHFFCRACARCWHAALGAYWRVAPSACDGCPERGRCLAVYDADHAAGAP